MSRTMKTFALQGDVAIIKIDTIPVDAVKQKAEGGSLIVTHSETGHNHVIEDDGDVMLFQDADDELQGYINTTKSVELKHLRSHDTHETVVIPADNYVVRRQREYTPEGYRRAAD